MNSIEILLNDWILRSARTPFTVVLTAAAVLIITAAVISAKELKKERAYHDNEAAVDNGKMPDSDSTV